MYLVLLSVLSALKRVTNSSLSKLMIQSRGRKAQRKQFSLLVGSTALVLMLASGCASPSTPALSPTNSASSSANNSEAGIATNASVGRTSTQSSSNSKATVNGVSGGSNGSINHARSSQTGASSSSALHVTGTLIPVVVSKNTDGDTIHVRLPNGQDKTIRMLLIDTPEDVKPNTPIEPYSLQAAAYAKKVLPVGRHIYIQEGKPGYTLDKYGRLLAYVFITKTDMYNIDVVRMGLARVAYIYPPNTDYLSTLEADQTYAKAHHLDIWSIPDYVTPTGYDVTIAVQWDKAHNYGGYTSGGTSSSGSTSSSQWSTNSTSSSGATSTTPSTGTSDLSVVSSTLSVSRGGEASVTVKTKPGAVGTIEVDYKSGPSHAKGLTSQTANSQGLITWQWTVGTSTSLGTWPVHILAAGKSITVYLHVN